MSDTATREAPKRVKKRDKDDAGTDHRGARFAEDMRSPTLGLQDAVGNQRAWSFVRASLLSTAPSPATARESSSYRDVEPIEPMAETPLVEPVVPDAPQVAEESCPSCPDDDPCPSCAAEDPTALAGDPPPDLPTSASEATSKRMPALKAGPLLNLGTSSGLPLDEATRQSMESSFGRDFSGVRVHTGARAAESARALNAAAFTRGRDVYFGAGRYQPRQKEGRHLIAHELAHVAQSEDALPVEPQTGSAFEGMVLGRPDDPIEREADRLAERAVEHEEQIPAEEISRASGGVLRRQAPATGVIVPIPDIQLFDALTYSKPWSGSTGQVPIWSGVVVIPYVGPIQLTLYAQGDASALFTAGLGPGVLRTIRIVLDPLASRYSGSAELYVPASVLGNLTLIGVLGGSASYAGVIPLLKIEGGLAVVGSGGLTSALVVPVSVYYDNGDIGFRAGARIDSCLQFNVSLSALARLALLGYPIWRGWWRLAGFSWGKCWRLGAELSVGWPGGVQLDFEAGEISFTDMLQTMLGEGPGGVVIGPPPPGWFPTPGVGPPGVGPPGGGARVTSPVTPVKNPTVNNNAGSAGCVPDAPGSPMTWDVITIDANNWGVDLQRYELRGTIDILQWRSSPNTMDVPNTANAVDGGNIENRPGSNNHWQYAIDDMTNYDKTGGGRGPHWHSTAATRAHEFAHWDRDWFDDAVISGSGGQWPTANSDLEALRESKSSSPSKSAARVALTPRVDSRMSTFRGAAVSRWNHLIGTTDNPGSGGRGYAAGQRVLDGLITQIDTYRRSKGWS